VQDIAKYLGDTSKVNWQSQGHIEPFAAEKSLLLTMGEGTAGSILASTHYVWYGKICATMRSSQGRGVVTAFIMMSDVRDEIDFEWVGVDLINVQSNYYSQGVTVYTNAANLSISNGNSVEKLHEYCLDWKPESLTWSVDGKDLRTKKKSETWNSTSNRFDYPQTPSRVMLSLWPAGLPTNAKGTVDWAGGLIDWNSDYMQNGAYLAQVQKVNVQCYDPPPQAKIKGKKSYKYTDPAATNNTVEISDDIVILGSLLGTGENPGKALTSGSPQASATIAMVPGGNPGGGTRQETPAAGGDSPQNTQNPGNTDQQNNNPSGNNNGEFVQNANGKNAGASLQPSLAKVQGSGLAIVLAILGLIVL